MKFRCPRCGEVFAVPAETTTLRCPACGQQLSIGADVPSAPAPGARASAKPPKDLKRTCPECSAQYPIDRGRCPECGASCKLATLQRQESIETGHDLPEDLPVPVRAVLAIVGLAMAIVGAILFRAAWDEGWIVGPLALLVMAGLGLMGYVLLTSGAAAQARAAHRRRRGLPPEPPDYQGPSQ